MINLLLFFDDSKLKEHFSGLDGNYTVITPSPMHADMSRLFFDSQRNFDVITISNFIKTYTSEIFDEEMELKLKRKSDLNLILGSLWRILHKDLSYELFQKSLTLLTDFRAFSLNEDVLSTILENYDDEIKNAVLWFHRTLEQLELIDEHKSYFLISEKLREGNLPILLKSEQKYVFMGFDFLTPAQIDMIQALAIRNDVYIPFQSEVFNKSKDFDWIKWITRFDTKILKIDECQEELNKLSTILISKNYLSKSLKELYLSKEDGVVICSKQVDQKMIAEIPYSNTKFKVQIDLLYKEVSQIEESLVTSTMDSNISKNDFLSLLELLIEKAIDREDFKYIKVVMLLKEILNEWSELSDKNTEIGTFEVKLFMESLRLNTPRNSLVNSIPGEIDVESLNSLDKVDNSKKYFFCATSEYGPIKSSVVDYSEDVQKYLATIGPIRRSEFEFEILKTKVIKKLKLDKSVLIIEKSLVKEDAGWSEILSNFNLKTNDLDLTKKRESLFQYFKDKKVDHNLKRYSASRLQAYIDCPQKYWYHYILKQSKHVTVRHHLSPMELGLIEHKIIELFLSQYAAYDEEVHNNLINIELDNVKKSFDRPVDKEHYFIEIKSYTQRAILDLIDIKELHNIEYTFEKEISSSLNNVVGSIDCYGVGADFNLLLDFKRGASSIPSQKGFFLFDKVQLWFYLKQISITNPDFLKKDFIFGYVNLSEPEKSLIFASSKEVKDLVLNSKNHIFSKISVVSEDFDSQFEDYKSYEKEIVQKIEDDSSYAANPLNDATCLFCDLKNICTR